MADANVTRSTDDGSDKGRSQNRLEHDPAKPLVVEHVTVVLAERHSSDPTTLLPTFIVASSSRRYHGRQVRILRPYSSVTSMLVL